MLLSIIFFLAASLSTVGLYLGLEQLSYWWILPLFVAFYAAWIIFYLFCLFVSSWFMSQKKPRQKSAKGCMWFIVETMDWLMRLLRVKITVKGRDIIPNEPCIFVSNHISCFDPMAMLAVLKDRRLAFISKESNMRIPLVGNFIYHAGFRGIDRENGMRALRTLKAASELIKASGIDMGIYPEGTRSKTGELLEFKTGAFLLAKRTDAPVVILVTRGTNGVVKRTPFRSTRVELEMLEVLSREQVKTLSLDEMSAYVRERLEKAL